jgi:hypothetical protein
MPREGLLARTFVELADTLVADFDVIELLPCSPTAAWTCSQSTPPGSCSSPPTGTYG